MALNVPIKSCAEGRNGDPDDFHNMSRHGHSVPITQHTRVDDCEDKLFN
jgi:hypothetical protein